MPSTIPSVTTARPSASSSAPGRSGRRLSAVGALRQQAAAGEEHGGAERQVDEEDQAPVGELDQGAAEGRPDRRRRGRRGAPEADAGGAFSVGKLSSTIASEVGAIIAAPMPCRTRKAISISSEGATAQSRLAAVKPAIPSRKMRLWPKRSARPPAGTSSAAMTTK